MKIAFYGSSLLSSYWNGAATYYRGILHALGRLGHEATFFEPDVLDRQARRDIEPPDWCRVEVYAATPEAMAAAAAKAAEADVVVKASGVGFMDDALMEAVMTAARPGALRVWWDVDAPATLAEIRLDDAHPLRRRLAGGVDLVLTYGGGPPVVAAYEALGPAPCLPVYNALDPETHHPVAPDPRFAADLALLANRLPDREARVEAFLFGPAERLPGMRFLLGGAGWDDKPLRENLRWIGHVPTADHNAFNVTPRAVLNVNRASMAQTGWSPPTRVFEAAGAGACLITDDWPGLGLFLAPDEEVLVARDGLDVQEIMGELTDARAREIGARARERLLGEHTYARRAAELDLRLRDALARVREGRLREGAA
jgi:spore maturation protein CgeB